MYNGQMINVGGEVVGRVQAEVGRELKTQWHQVAHGQGLESKGTALVLTDLLDSSHGALKIILFILEKNGATFKYFEMHW